MTRARRGDACFAPAPFPSADVSSLLRAWYKKAGRNLPWRQTREPYRIWLSEIMLQQTTVAAVLPRYERFLAAFPDVAALAAAPVETVVEAWAGLGYYSRARNLHAAARQVMADHGGRFPADPAALQALPGVGRSTAGAILSLAFDIPAPILDGNVRRVLCRLCAWQNDPRGSAAERQLWKWAEALTPAQDPHDYTQAIMDLGATVCIPRAPRCAVCPLASLCLARRQGLEKELPRRGTSKTVPRSIQVALILHRRGRVLVRRRPLEGLLGGLWEFPTAAVPEGPPMPLALRLLTELGYVGMPVAAALVRHAYSHFRLELHLFTVAVEENGQCAEGEGQRWIAAEELADWPLHGAHKKGWAALASTTGSWHDGR